jgi:hypothetical protein
MDNLREGSKLPSLLTSFLTYQKNRELQMSREHPQMRIRLPPELKEKIEEAAHDNRRSMNAEVIARLQASFEEDAGELMPDQTELLMELLKKLIETLEAQKRQGNAVATEV